MPLASGACPSEAVGASSKTPKAVSSRVSSTGPSGSIMSPPTSFQPTKVLPGREGSAGSTQGSPLVSWKVPRSVSVIRSRKKLTV